MVAGCGAGGAGLDVFVAERGLEEVLGAEGGFVRERGPDTVRAPAVVVVAGERVPAARGRFVELAPEWVVEGVSLRGPAGGGV